jgi:hypothetical protein
MDLFEIGRRAFLLSALALSVYASTSVRAFAESFEPTEKREVLLGNVFVPAEGYDERSLVRITLDGTLQDGCEQLGESRVEREGAWTFVVRQFAERREGPCANPRARTFEKTIELGQLAAGQYRIDFNTQIALHRTSEFEVSSLAQASSPQIDKTRLAQVDSIQIPEVVNGVYPIQAVLKGRLENSCDSITQEKVFLEPEGNVILAAVVVASRPGELCWQVPRPFELKMDLGKLDEGRYQIRAGSREASSSRIFEVVRPDPQ